MPRTGCGLPASIHAHGGVYECIAFFTVFTAWGESPWEEGQNNEKNMFLSCFLLICEGCMGNGSQATQSTAPLFSSPLNYARVATLSLFPALSGYWSVSSQSGKELQNGIFFLEMASEWQMSNENHTWWCQASDPHPQRCSFPKCTTSLRQPWVVPA